MSDAQPTLQRLYVALFISLKYKGDLGNWYTHAGEQGKRKLFTFFSFPDFTCMPYNLCMGVNIFIIWLR